MQRDIELFVGLESILDRLGKILFMDEIDEDFWVAHIACTPEEDREFEVRGCGHLSAFVLLAAALAGVLAWLAG